MAQERGSIAFFGTYRPPVPLDIYSSPAKPNNSKPEENLLTDGESYNFNGHVIPQATLDVLLEHPKLEDLVIEEADVKYGMVFVSERTNSLETLHIALCIGGEDRPRVYSLVDLYGDVFSGARMEDSGCFAGENIVYVSTKEAAAERRQPWTAVYTTNLRTGETRRLTPLGTADLNPVVSPSGKKIAVASFQNMHGGWTGEIEHLETDIFVMDVDGSNRHLVVSNGGWPTWGSDHILFFHRGEEFVVPTKDGKTEQVKKWGVFKADVSQGFTSEMLRVTPKDIEAMTPAAIDASTVAVATIRDRLGVAAIRKNTVQYRHIEIFSTNKPQEHSVRVTESITGKADHYNPFVLEGGNRIGYHRCRQGRIQCVGSGVK